MTKKSVCDFTGAEKEGNRLTKHFMGIILKGNRSCKEVENAFIGKLCAVIFYRH